MHADLCVHEKKNTESVKNNSKPKVKFLGKKKNYQYFLTSIFYFGMETHAFLHLFF